MEQTAETLLPATRIAVLCGFALVAAIALGRARGAGLSGRWVAAAFSAISGALLLAWLPPFLDVELPSWAGDLVLLLIIAFPYLLLRFTASFVPLRRWLEIAAAGMAGLAVIAVAWIVWAPDGPGRGVLLAITLAYWVATSLVTVVRLWHAGRDQPTVVRRSMRLMSAGALVLAVALVLTVQGGASALVALGVNAFALLSAIAFGIGFSPPGMIRRVWRQPEEEQLQAATVSVLRARTAEEVASELLPPTVRMVNGGGAVLTDPDGRVVATFGDAPRTDTVLGDDHALSTFPRMVLPLDQHRGDLVVWTSPYTPFFGRQDLDLLRSMAALAALALERCDLLAEERAQKASLRDAQQDADRARHEADRANTAKSEFLSRMSHELRTPLNSILGFGQLLESSTLAEDDQEGVGYILKAGRHLLALIDDVLDLSRIEAGTMTISLEPVHATEVINDTLSLIRPHANSRSIQLHLDETSCDAYVMTDRQRARQVLLNLLSNAVKYNHDGGSVAVTCSLVEDHRHLRICVRDSGPGIDLARQQRLFEPFERLGAESSSIEGTGLGLALTKQLVERIGGSITVESAPGEGSTFCVELPVTEQPATLHAPIEPADANAPATGSTLLLVEDNLANLRVVEAMLKRRPGITVIPAMQGRLALDLAHDHQPELIILDLHLPDLSGREILHRLRSDPATRHIPVIIASADATPSRVRELLNLGAFAYITKPLDLKEFLDAIDAAMIRGAASSPASEQADRPEPIPPTP